MLVGKEARGEEDVEVFSEEEVVGRGELSDFEGEGQTIGEMDLDGKDFDATGVMDFDDTGAMDLEFGSTKKGLYPCTFLFWFDFLFVVQICMCIHSVRLPRRLMPIFIFHCATSRCLNFIMARNRSLRFVHCTNMEVCFFFFVLSFYIFSFQASRLC